MKLSTGVYIPEIYSTLLQKNTIQLNKFLSSMDLTDIINMFDELDTLLLNKLRNSYDSGNHVEFIIENFPNKIIAKVYKPKFYNFKKEGIEIKYDIDYSDLTLFYKIADDIDSIIININEEISFLMQEEIEGENSL